MTILVLTIVFIAFAEGGVVATYEDSDSTSNCKTEVNISIPPCVCAGYEDLVVKSYQLEEELKKTRKNLTMMTENVIGN